MWSLAVLLVSGLPALAAAPHPVWSTSWMLATPNRHATDAGALMLEQGGSAVDAAVAAGFVLGVVEMYSSGIGGGGFLLHYDGTSHAVTALDGRESAPAAATSDMFLDPLTREPRPELSFDGALAVAVPGEVALFYRANQDWGKLSWSTVLQPAIQLAADGFLIDLTWVQRLEDNREKLLQHPGTRALFFHQDSTLLGLGELLVQPELAVTLRLLADRGPDYFYYGEFAATLDSWMWENGGLVRAADLAGYTVRLMEPVTGSYRGCTVYSMPPPSSGGVHLIQMLNYLEEFDLAQLGLLSSRYIHTVASAMGYAYADRSLWLGDPAFFPVPVEGLTSKGYAATQRERYSRVQRERLPGAGDPLPWQEGEHTSHISVVDGEGNAVSMTCTINTRFGSGVILPGTGVLLNNEMDDFSMQPGVPNYYGLIGSEANSIQPGKRPLSSMTPTIITRDDRLQLVIGSPGGAKIITTVLQTIINTIDFEMDIQAAIDAPRFHYQWRPDYIRLEPDLPDDVLWNLRQYGYQVYRTGHWSAAQGVWRDAATGLLYGGSDSRVDGSARGNLP
ncbi:MAG: gamma-glutamyltransferase [Candidatus Delongbacteria bacterium]|nr:gamma-glutamyltransferase [Candidatus Delongbacteria bacterium]